MGKRVHERLDSPHSVPPVLSMDTEKMLLRYRSHIKWFAVWCEVRTRIIRVSARRNLTLHQQWHVRMDTRKSQFEMRIGKLREAAGLTEVTHKGEFIKAQLSALDFLKRRETAV